MRRVPTGRADDLCAAHIGMWPGPIRRLGRRPQGEMSAGASDAYSPVCRSLSIETPPVPGKKKGTQGREGHAGGPGTRRVRSARPQVEERD